MPDILAELFHDQNPQKLRVSRPSKFIFLCGGAVSRDKAAKPENLRDYLYRVRPMRLPYEIVLAERATQLYRDTKYHDLISFEEDIARIAAVVLVIPESPGSLAELGAFASNETIRRSLRVVLQEKHEKDESFIRYGPVERVRREKRENLGVYPWRTHAKNGRLVVKSIKEHYTEIVNFIDRHAGEVPKSFVFNNTGESRTFYIIYWIIHMSLAVSTAMLYKYVQEIDNTITKEEIKNKVYCMILARWIEKKSYSGKDYYFVLYDEDPFDYSFKESAAEKFSIRRKMDVRKALEKEEKLPKYVRKTAAEGRRPRK